LRSTYHRPSNGRARAAISEYAEMRGDPAQRADSARRPRRPVSRAIPTGIGRRLHDARSVLFHAHRLDDSVREVRYPILNRDERIPVHRTPLSSAHHEGGAEVRWPQWPSRWVRALRIVRNVASNLYSAGRPSKQHVSSRPPRQTIQRRSLAAIAIARNQAPWRIGLHLPR